MSDPITRRTMISALAAAGVLRSANAAPVILLRSGWQSVNIGDVTHTPGALTLIEKALPQAKVLLWPGEIERGVEPMLQRRFPKLAIVRGSVDTAGKPDTPELADAFRTAQLFIHGSAAAVNSTAQFEAWRKTTGKPYGFLGIGFTFEAEAAGTKGDDRLKNLLSGASFVYTRETASLANLNKAQIQGPKLGFCPDATFSFDIRDDATGDAFLSAHSLGTGKALDADKFIAVIPRLRYTPYHLIRKTPPYGPEEQARRTQINDKWAEQDHGKLREVIVAWVRKTGGKVLLCPEMTYEVDLLEPLLYRALPDDVKPYVVRRETFWLPDEAASVYRRASAVISFECHSPIIAATVGTPCIYVHQPEDGIKGHMYADVGLSDWYFEVEQTTGSAIANRVLEIAANPKAAARKVAVAVDYARKKEAEAMLTVKALLA